MTSSDFDLNVIGAGLPFAAALEELRRALVGGVAVVQAPPGSGKTTLVPPLIAGEVAGRVLVTQPRRIAVRAAARRLTELTGQPLGGRVGYTVRGEREVSDATRVEFCTPGVLLRRVLADPGLPGIGAVILDEVHERGLETDLLVGMLAQVRQLREDLTLVAMSATLDAARFTSLLGDETPAPVIDSGGALHALRVEWAPTATGRPRFDARGVSREFLRHVADVTVDSLRAGPRDADALVFLPGAWEVSTVAATLRGQLVADAFEVLELHGRVPAPAQDRVTSGRRA
ncbi:MAG: DEAD/DEAH box helicase, partial [Micrococcales bacterium]|nr:DEAD/DEAH box helicase [Micrococcales bacterium]